MARIRVSSGPIDGGSGGRSLRALEHRRAALRRKRRGPRLSAPRRHHDGTEGPVADREDPKSNNAPVPGATRTREVLRTLVDNGVGRNVQT
jgi:hypothetical protein